MLTGSTHPRQGRTRTMKITTRAFGQFKAECEQYARRMELPLQGRANLILMDMITEGEDGIMLSIPRNAILSNIFARHLNALRYGEINTFVCAPSMADAPIDYVDLFRILYETFPEKDIGTMTQTVPREIFVAPLLFLVPHWTIEEMISDMTRVSKALSQTIEYMRMANMVPNLETYKPIMDILPLIAERKIPEYEING